MNKIKHLMNLAEDSLEDAILPDYPKKEEGVFWFTTISGKSLLRSNVKTSLPKLKGWKPTKFQVGALRFYYWGLMDIDGKFMTVNGFEESGAHFRMTYKGYRGEDREPLILSSVNIEGYSHVGQPKASAEINMVEVDVFFRNVTKESLLAKCERSIAGTTWKFVEVNPWK